MSATECYEKYPHIKDVPPINCKQCESNHCENIKRYNPEQYYYKVKE
jgi:hypothetical protein